jgi:glycosyltransferase involved in cell wall biosynthesis
MSVNQVLIATHILNEEERLPRLLDSLTSQSYQNLKLFISDNHSDDKSSQILASYSTKLQLRVVRPPHRLGQLENFFYMSSQLQKEAVQDSRIFYLGADDYFLGNDAVLNLVNSVKTSDVEITLPTINIISPKGKSRTTTSHYRSHRTSRRLVQLSLDSISTGVQAHHSLMSSDAFFFWVKRFLVWHGNQTGDRDSFAEYMALWDLVAKYPMNYCENSVFVKEVNNRKDTSNRIKNENKKGDRIQYSRILKAHHSKNLSTFRLLKQRKKLTQERINVFLVLSFLAYLKNGFADSKLLMNLIIQRLRNRKNS